MKRILTTHVGSLPTRPLITQGRDRDAFADFYRYAAERGTLFYAPGEQIKRERLLWYCTGRVSYRGLASLQREISTLLKFAKPEEAFLTSTAPGSLEVYRRDEYYRCDNVIAGADCGFGGRSHPQIAWAKLRSLVEGAELASKALFS